jgi:hypothetical protein
MKKTPITTRTDHEGGQIYESLKMFEAIRIDVPRAGEVGQATIIKLNRAIINVFYTEGVWFQEWLRLGCGSLF